MSEFNQLWEQIFGNQDRIGWWTVPVFLGVGLFGAVVAGALATIYYSQQVSAIEEQTREVREDLSDAVERVEEAAQQAIRQIEERLENFDDEVAQPAPAVGAEELGLVVVRVDVPLELPQPSPPPATPSPSPDSGPSPIEPSPFEPSPFEPSPFEPTPPATDFDVPSPSPVAARVRAAQTADPEGAQPPQEPGAGVTPTPGPPSIEPPRLGVAFAIARQGGATFFLTSMSLVAAPHLPGGTVSEVSVLLPERTVTGSVHTWDERYDVAIIRAGVDVKVADWRPAEEPLIAGDVVYALGYTPAFEAVQVPTTVASTARAEGLFTTGATQPLPTGGPIVDREGRVVAVVTPQYFPFGGGTEWAAVPIRTLCGPLLQRCGATES